MIINILKCFQNGTLINFALNFVDYLSWEHAHLINGVIYIAIVPLMFALKGAQWQRCFINKFVAMVNMITPKNENIIELVNLTPDECKCFGSLLIIGTFP